MEILLDPAEARVLACLIEKSITTPEYYPLTLNALIAACNQKSNRDPEMLLPDKEVVRALDSLRDRNLASSVTLAGSRAPKYRYNLPESLSLAPPHIAVLCELMLRGPQTLGELRTHAGRMAEIPDTAAVQTIVQDLASRQDGPLATVLPRQPGRREERYAHLLCGAPPAGPETPTHAPEPARPAVMAENERLILLEARVATLEEALAQLNARFAN
jgi:uncharacterized protein YceH (UPF0502 family)